MKYTGGHVGGDVLNPLPVLILIGDLVSVQTCHLYARCQLAAAVLFAETYCINVLALVRRSRLAILKYRGDGVLRCRTL